ncbi:mechanosensitive ion channel [Sulfurovum sp. bin170]|uniref:mechanosensitive ion channel family protein n=1 Tax=Sulfurovum sp. bin170 TaxID=2695268 RepID=UPI0013DEB77B|nr:mechanosensitive ion channel domain-containing protein [Sulfurovum sp. bin170]NEW60654.1 mechanosensitive ion channel [Sulfurovum sp. bin170]
MRLIFLLFLLATHTLFADLNITDRVSKIISDLGNSPVVDIEVKKEEKKVKIEESMTEEDILEKRKRDAEFEKKRLEQERLKELTRIKTNLLKDLEGIDAYLQQNSMWSNVYSNHETYKSLEFTLINLNSRIEDFEKRSKLTKKEEKALKKYKDDYKTAKGTIIQLKDYKEDPFKKLLAPDDLGKAPEVLSPLNIISAISFQKHLRAVEEDYSSRFIALKEIVAKLYNKNRILMKLVVLNRDMNISQEKYTDAIELLSKEIDAYNSNLEIFKSNQDLLKKNISDMKLKIKSSIKKEAEKGIAIGATILFLLLIFFFIKYLVRKYMSENELFYTTNKALNFVFITIVFFILLFSYLENVSHLANILAFASAGIAIALKDWFMSMMGWLVIIFSGSIHVGDRIKVAKDGNEYVGDVVDISLLRMTLHEDVTLTTDMINRRAGRILFVPNNYIFTDMIANYSHSGLKTVWDGIDFMITFDSDVVKAQSIAKEVSRKYSKGYTDMTRKQLNKLRSKYSMRNTSVEPRIFAFLDENGVRISVWYLTNAYATLTLRSTISMEILSKIREEDRISIAFPSQSLYLDKVAPKELKSKSDIFKDKFNKEHGNEPKTRYKPDDWGLY